jgi:5'-nucleotidase / UDP-sugar diphosphatase
MIGCGYVGETGMRSVGPILCLLAGLMLGQHGAAAAERRVSVTLVLICDIYEMTDRNGRGGFARVAAAVAAERLNAANVIVAHAGDTLSPSLMSGLDKGAHIIDLTNMIAPDVFVPGNHEFDFGEEVFRERMAEAEFPLLAANLRDDAGNLLPGFADTRTFGFDGIAIGVMGLTAEHSAETSSPGTLTFSPSVETAKRVSRELRDGGADIVVAVAHAPIRTDLRLMATGALDVLLAGHDHDLIVTYDGRTAMAEAKEEGEYVVAIDLDIRIDDAASPRVRWWPRFRIIDTFDVEPDPEVADRVAAYQESLSKALDGDLARTDTALDSRKQTVRGGEAAIGNMIADAMREIAGADVALMNGGGIRGNRTYDAGSTLTRRDIQAELPFGNKLVKATMAGRDLLAALENGLWFAGKADGRFAQVSGLRLRARADGIPGKRIDSVEIAGVPLDPDRSYTVATNDFILRGQDGYDAFTRAETMVGANDGELLAGAVIIWLESKSTVAPKVEGRIVIE